MAELGPNSDLWMVTARPRQPLKGVFYIQSFYPKISLLAVLLKHLLLANCVIVNKAVVQLNCSAHLSWESYDFLVKSNCFVLIVQQ